MNYVFKETKSFDDDTINCKKMLGFSVPADVKDCFDVQRITRAAEQCGRLTGSSVTNQACGYV